MPGTVTNKEKVLQAYPEGRCERERWMGSRYKSYVYVPGQTAALGEGFTAAEAWREAVKHTRIANGEAVVIRKGTYWVNGYIADSRSYVVHDNRGEHRMSVAEVERGNGNARRVAISDAPSQA
jgi:hypothetical protein